MWLINGTNKISSLATFILYLRSSNQKRNALEFGMWNSEFLGLFSEHLMYLHIHCLVQEDCTKFVHMDLYILKTKETIKSKIQWIQWILFTNNSECVYFVDQYVSWCTVFRICTIINPRVVFYRPTFWRCTFMNVCM